MQARKKCIHANVNSESGCGQRNQNTAHRIIDLCKIYSSVNY